MPGPTRTLAFPCRVSVLHSRVLQRGHLRLAESVARAMADLLVPNWASRANTCKHHSYTDLNFTQGYRLCHFTCLCAEGECLCWG